MLDRDGSAFLEELCGDSDELLALGDTLTSASPSNSVTAASHKNFENGEGSTGACPLQSSQGASTLPPRPPMQVPSIRPKPLMQVPSIVSPIEVPSIPPMQVPSTVSSILVEVPSKPPIRRLATYFIRPQGEDGSIRSFAFALSRGSVVNFACSEGHAAIVCATNEMFITSRCAVDGAVVIAGGSTLLKHVTALRPVCESVWGAVLCPTGDARMIGPGTFGALGVDHVILAVGLLS